MASCPKVMPRCRIVYPETSAFGDMHRARSRTRRGSGEDLPLPVVRSQKRPALVSGRRHLAMAQLVEDLTGLLITLGVAPALQGRDCPQRAGR